MRSGQANRLTVESSLRTTLIIMVYIFYSSEFIYCSRCVCDVEGRRRAVERAHIHCACMHAYSKILKCVARKRSSGERNASHKEAAWDLIRFAGLGL